MLCMCSGEGGWSPWSHGPCSHTCGTELEQAPRTAPLLTILTSALVTAPSTKHVEIVAATVSITCAVTCLSLACIQI